MILSATKMIRRLKADILTQLPPKGTHSLTYSLTHSYSLTYLLTLTLSLL